MRYDHHEKRYRDVLLAGDNPRQPPENPSRPFLHHIEAIGRRMGDTYRLHWKPEQGIWHIQRRINGDRWQSVFMAYDAVRAHEGNPYPFMPLDMRVVEEFAQSCLEIRYDTTSAEIARQLAEAAAVANDGKPADGGKAQEAAMNAAIRCGFGVDGDDEKTLEKKVRYTEYGPSDATGFKSVWSVPQGAPDVPSR